MKASAMGLMPFVMFMSVNSMAQEERPVPVESPTFGKRGTAVISGAFNLDVGASVYDDPNVYSTNVIVSPSADWFVMDNFSFGASFDFKWTGSKGYSTHGAIDRRATTWYGLAMRIGYNVPLGRFVSWWPRLHLGYSGANTILESSESPPGYEGDRSADLGGIWWEYKESGPYVYAFAPLLIHPVPHWYFGLGPAVYRDLGRTFDHTAHKESNRTTASLFLTTGIWF